jgi:hypothetical protein
MREQICGVLWLLVALACTADLVAREKTIVADAIEWYSIWWMSETRGPAMQTCRGEHRGNVYSLRCDPIGLVMNMEEDREGRCRAQFVGPSTSPSDGLRVISPASQKDGDDRIALSRGCGEIPSTEGAFEFSLRPSARTPDRQLSLSVQRAAIRYFRESYAAKCLVRYPKVRSGDPFAHVYLECDGTLDSVWEFAIFGGKVSEFAHWTYTMRKGGFPAGAESRVRRPELWLGSQVR